MSHRLTLAYTCWDHPGAGPLPRYEVRRGEDDFELFAVDCSGSDQSDALDAMFFLAVKAGIAEWHPTMRPAAKWVPSALEAKEPFADEVDQCECGANVSTDAVPHHPECEGTLAQQAAVHSGAGVGR